MKGLVLDHKLQNKTPEIGNGNDVINTSILVTHFRWSIKQKLLLFKKSFFVKVTPH